jgi:hypothetical protein
MTCDVARVIVYPAGLPSCSKTHLLNLPRRHRHLFCRLSLRQGPCRPHPLKWKVLWRVCGEFVMCDTFVVCSAVRKRNLIITPQMALLIIALQVT